MNNETRLELMIALRERLHLAEDAVRSLGLAVADEPMPVPLSGDPLLAALYAQELHERFFRWNCPLLVLENHLERPNPRRRRARSVGRIAHAWYEDGKPLYRDLGLARVDPVMRALYAEATALAKDGDEIAREFLAWRDAQTPITFAVRRQP